MNENNLRTKRILMRMNQFDLRLKTGIHQSKISLIENGYYTPTDEEKRKIGKVLKCRADDLSRKQLRWRNEKMSNLAIVKQILSRAAENENKIFLNTFKGRPDVYAVKWKNKEGKTGFSPACKNKFKAGYSEGSKPEYWPYNSKVVEFHLSGKEVIGIYPLLSNNASCFVAVDFDGKNGDPLKDAKAFIDVCEIQGIPAYLERSQSGNGYHVWIFFDKPIPAWKSRTVVKALLLKAPIDVTKGSFDRILPNQDRLSGKGLGNLIALPLQGEQKIKEGKSVFLNTSNGLEPYPNQFEFLKTIKKVKENQLEKFIADRNLSSENNSAQKYLENKTPIKELYKGVCESKRNGSLSRLAGSWVRDGLSLKECLEIASIWNSRNIPPLPQNEIFRTVESIHKTHQKDRKPASQFNGIYRDSETVKLKISSVKDILEYPDPEYLIEGLLFKDTATILNSPPSVGKSVLSLLIAKSIATGEPFLDVFQVNHKGNVLIIDEENPGSILKDRLNKFKIFKDMPLHFLHYQGVRLDSDNSFNELLKVVNDVKPILIIFDSLIRLHGCKETIILK